MWVFPVRHGVLTMQLVKISVIQLVANQCESMWVILGKDWPGDGFLWHHT